MADFLGDDFLLGGETARWLFHEVARTAPIIDVHTHLPADVIAGDHRFETLTDLWLGNDHYKWRAMRLAGVDEQLVTGDTDPWDRFEAWAATVPRLLGNPLYLWTHLELRRVFGIDLTLSPNTAAEIWEEANRQLPGWTVRKLLDHFHVAAVATSDDPGDDLASHRRLRDGSGGSLAVVPTWRPDDAHQLLEHPGEWNQWADRLGSASAITVEDLDSLLAALEGTRRHFAEAGGRASDHGLVSLPDAPADPDLADRAVHRVRRGEAVTTPERRAVELEVVGLAARLAHEGGSVLQLHLGARRDASERLFRVLGRDAGSDVISDEPQAAGLARFLGGLDGLGRLPRSVLYNLNPADNAVFAAMAGAFSQSGVPSLVQWGPPWWFNDHEKGMRQQIGTLAAIGQLAGFMGMVTDSRSFLSMTRHELFRRVLCDVIGSEVDSGRLPAGDSGWLATVVHDVSVANAARHFGLPVPPGR